MEAHSPHAQRLPEQPRPLILAESVDSEGFGLSRMGWEHYRALAERFPGAHLVTHLRNRAALIEAGLREGLDFTAIDPERNRGWACRLSRLLPKWLPHLFGPLGEAFWYCGFEGEVWRAFSSELKRGRFDVVHRIHPIDPSLPSVLAKRCEALGCPFVMGPLNRAKAHPAKYERFVRALLRGGRQKDSGELVASVSRQFSRALLLGSRALYERLPLGNRANAFYLSEGAVESQRDPEPKRLPRLPIQALVIAREGCSGAEIVVEAGVDYLRWGMLEVTIIAEGARREALEAWLAQQGVVRGIQIQGTPAQERYAESDLFFFPSCWEVGGIEIMESMARGAIPVVVDHGDLPSCLTEATSFVIPPGNRAALVKHLRRLLARLVEHPEEIQPISHAAIRHAQEEFTWETKVNRDEAIYQWILKGGTKPDCGFPSN